MLSTEQHAWDEIRNLASRNLSLRELFQHDQNRGATFSVKAGDIYVDYSKNLIDEILFSKLIELAKSSKIEENRDAMFRGEKINTTENRAVLHTALRQQSNDSVYVDGEDVIPEIKSVLHKMENLSNAIRNGEWLGYSGKPIKNIINIGIGGSDLGPVMATEALKHYSQKDLTIRFISNIDGTHFDNAIDGLNPDETLFIVASKTFTTDETMTNAETAKSWLLNDSNDVNSVKAHFVAISTNYDKVTEFGIDPNNVLEFWDWVGGRFSMTSAIGFSIMISIGPSNFNEMLLGFNELDEHFKNAPLEKNAPVILALLSTYYANFLGAQSEAVLPYDQYFHRLPAYLQQASMESNGKSVSLDGEIVNYNTGSIIWGEPGTNGQHAFYQLIHQGTHLIPCDFIGFSKSLNLHPVHHEKLIANMLAQSAALAFGKTADEVRDEEELDELIPHKVFRGNQPSNTLLIPRLTPRTLGQLIALYEHKIFAQGVLLNINSFDQWGVELGKVLAKRIYSDIKSGDNDSAQDSSTSSLLNLFREQS